MSGFEDRIREVLSQIQADGLYKQERLITGAHPGAVPKAAAG